MKCGWTCLVEYPFTDGSGAKVRPVLIVSKDQYNGGDDVVVVPISSRPDPSDPYSVFVGDSSPSFAATGLKFSSAVKWGKPFTICKTLILRRLGQFDATLMGEVRSGLAALFL